MATGEVGHRTGRRLPWFWDAALGATQRAGCAIGLPHRGPHRVLQRSLLHTVHVLPPSWAWLGMHHREQHRAAPEGASQGVTTGCITVCINGRSTHQGGGGQNRGTCCRCYPGICKMRQLKIIVTWRQEIRAKSRETSGFDSLLGSGPGEPVRRTCEGCKKPRPRRGARDSVLGTCWIAVQPIGQRRSAGRVKLEG